jgi:hypothetical protein
MNWAGVWHIWGRRDIYKVLVQKTLGKRSHGTPRHIWDYNTETNLTEVVWEARSGLMWLRIGTDDCGVF